MAWVTSSLARLREQIDDLPFDDDPGYPLSLAERVELNRQIVLSCRRSPTRIATISGAQTMPHRLREKRFSYGGLAFWFDPDHYPNGRLKLDVRASSGWLGTLTQSCPDAWLAPGEFCVPPTSLALLMEKTGLFIDTQRLARSRHGVTARWRFAGDLVA